MVAWRRVCMPKWPWKPSWSTTTLTGSSKSIWQQTHWEIWRKCWTKWEIVVVPLMVRQVGMILGQEEEGEGEEVVIDILTKLCNLNLVFWKQSSFITHFLWQFQSLEKKNFKSVVKYQQPCLLLNLCQIFCHKVSYSYSKMLVYMAKKGFLVKITLIHIVSSVSTQI